MTQPEQAVGGEPIAPDLTPEDRLNAAFADPENIKEEVPEEEGEGALEPEAIEEAEDDTELEAEIDELPPIDAPVSWDAEAKAVFAALPRDAQEIVTKREAEREKFVQQKSQEAARAKQEVEQSAYQQLAQYDRQVAEHLAQLASQIGPKRPDPAMLQYDPAGFYAAQAQYEGHAAQQQQLQQQAQEHAQQAQAREAEAERLFHAQQHQLLVETFPEYLDPTSGPKLQQELSATARYLGYPPELIEAARAPDIIAMKKVADLKAKADRYDALMAKKMEKVREAKKLNPVSRPGIARAPGVANQQQLASDREAMRRGDRDATTRVLDSFFTQQKR